MKKGKVVIGTLAGVAIGAIAGILFAPEKGSTTRKQIRDKSNDYMGNLKSKLDKLRESLSQKAEIFRNDAEELVDKGKENYNEAKNDLKNAATKFKQDVAAEADHHGKFSFNDQSNNKK